MEQLNILWHDHLLLIIHLYYYRKRIHNLALQKLIIKLLILLEIKAVCENPHDTYVINTSKLKLFGMLKIFFLLESS